MPSPCVESNGKIARLQFRLQAFPQNRNPQ